MCTVTIDTSTSREPRYHTGAGRDDPELAFGGTIFTPHPDARHGPEYGSVEEDRSPMTVSVAAPSQPCLHLVQFFRQYVHLQRGCVPAQLNYSADATLCLSFGNLRGAQVSMKAEERYQLTLSDPHGSAAMYMRMRSLIPPPSRSVKVLVMSDCTRGLSIEKPTARRPYACCSIAQSWQTYEDSCGHESGGSFVSSIWRAEHHLPNVTPCVARGMDRGADGCRKFLRLVELDIVKPSKASSV
jgi:hypothetical protein